MGLAEYVASPGSVSISSDDQERGQIEAHLRKRWSTKPFSGTRWINCRDPDRYAGRLMGGTEAEASLKFRQTLVVWGVPDAFGACLHFRKPVPKASLEPLESLFLAVFINAR